MSLTTDMGVRRPSRASSLPFPSLPIPLRRAHTDLPIRERRLLRRPDFAGTFKRKLQELNMTRGVLALVQMEEEAASCDSASVSSEEPLEPHKQVVSAEAHIQRIGTQKTRQVQNTLDAAPLPRRRPETHNDQTVAQDLFARRLRTWSL